MVKHKDMEKVKNSMLKNSKDMEKVKRWYGESKVDFKENDATKSHQGQMYGLFSLAA